MNCSRIFITVTACVFLTACAGFPPNANELSSIPKIDFGQPIPKDKDYILHFPAGTPLPVLTLVGGNIFEKDDQATLHVTLRHEVFLYRQFASLDGQNWKRAGKLIETQLEFQIPQKNGDKAGLLQLKLDQK